jgi:6-phosphofructokinase 1
MAKRIGLLTGGGDCPGLNAVIRAVVRNAITVHKAECVGILRGWRGLLDGLTTPLTLDAVSGILPRGGTILRTSQTNPFATPNGAKQVMANVKRFGLDAVIASGSEHTFGTANRLHKEHGLNVVGIPTTIDNDVQGTEYAFGFDSTVNIAMEAIDRIHTTAESHDRVMVVEVMGRQAGWIALYSGIAGGADIILIPETPFTMQEVCDKIVKRHDQGKDFSIVVVAEGVKIGNQNHQPDAAQSLLRDDSVVMSFSGVGQIIADEIQNRTGAAARPRRSTASSAPASARRP